MYKLKKLPKGIQRQFLKKGRFYKVRIWVKSEKNMIHVGQYKSLGQATEAKRIAVCFLEENEESTKLEIHKAVNIYREEIGAKKLKIYTIE